MKYWVYMNGEVPGCYTPQELSALNGFSGTTLVCPAEGEIVEKNWRRSGEFSEIIAVMQDRDAARAPAAPDPFTGDVNQFLDSTSARLFGQVSTLMHELETRREEQALLQTVQRQLVELQAQMQKTREKNIEMEGRMARLRELEEATRRDQERIHMLETGIKGREEGLAELRVQLEKTRGEADAARKRVGDTLNDLAIRNRLVDKLSRDLTEKELNLTKALGLIRRLEEDLHKAVPQPMDPAVAAAAAIGSSAGMEAVTAAPAAELNKEEASPAAEAAPAQTPEAPAAQSAIINAFKKLVQKDLHQ